MIIRPWHGCVPLKYAEAFAKYPPGFTCESRKVYVASMHPAVTCAATIGRLVSEELGDGQSDEIPQCYRPSRFSVLQG